MPPLGGVSVQRDGGPCALAVALHSTQMSKHPAKPPSLPILEYLKILVPQFLGISAMVDHHRAAR
jgi:hypothetical protein